MPVKISVTQIRNELLSSMKPSFRESSENPSSVKFGQIFHQTFASLFHQKHNETLIGMTIAHKTAASLSEAFQELVYSGDIGPFLSRERSGLEKQSERVLSLWKSCRNMCDWAASLLFSMKLEGYNWQDGGFPIIPGEPLAIELKEPLWTDSVVLTGVMDLIVRVPDESGWCVVELKSGRSRPEIDLAQCCLYDLILSGSAGRTSTGKNAVAVLRFTPEKEELFFKASEIEVPKKQLIGVIGKVAGVIPDSGQNHEEISITPDRNSEKSEVTESGPGKLDFSKLESIFREYGKEIFPMGEPVSGPSFIRYPIRLGKGVRIGAIRKIAPELQHRMKFDAPPFVHMQNGRVVIDIQRMDRQTIHFSEIRKQLSVKDPLIGGSRVILGVDMESRVRYADLSEPDNVHILAAGTTSSGKSEWLRSVVAGLILTNTPDTLRLLLIDPKRNTFNELKDHPMLMGPVGLVYPDEHPCVEILCQLADEMDSRYLILEKEGADDRNHYVSKTRTPMPRIVCVCDEYFDLVSRDREERKELESQIFRLGAKARAAGIHLVIATQQPNRQTIKGALDVNIPARVAFRMSRNIESKMVIGQKGAENLLGSGDLLFKDIGNPIRLQAPLMSLSDRRDIFL